LGTGRHDRVLAQGLKVPARLAGGELERRVKLAGLKQGIGHAGIISEGWPAMGSRHTVGGPTPATLASGTSSVDVRAQSGM
jgi:hypothetical protein